MSGDAAALVPPGWRLRPDRALRRLEGGRVLLGGVPMRLLRLGPTATRHVESWLTGAPVADRPGARTLARRLLDAGLAHPAPSAPPDGGVTVVVPVRDRPVELARCLEALGRAHPVVVVDDASDQADAVAAVARQAGARLVRRPVTGGPGAARNTGLQAARTPFVAFVDSDCVPSAGWIERLLPHLGDAAVAAVAPRIVAAGMPARHGLAAYENVHSPLDMGPEESIVRPGTRVPYVPSTALVVRAPALGAGFDPALRFGEDVDLVWRLVEAGWTVRYDPGVRVAHDHRVSALPWLRTRIAYNGAAAPLARRHPGALHAAYLSRWSLAAWAAGAAGRPLLAAGSVAAATVMLRKRLAPHVDRSERIAASVVGRGLLRDGAGLAGAVRGPWLPLALAASAPSRRVRRILAGALVAAPLLEWCHDRPPLDPVTATLGRCVDDAARGLGVWRGCLRHGTYAPLLPAVGASPSGLAPYAPASRWIRQPAA